MIAFMKVQGYIERFSFGGVAERHMSARELLSSSKSGNGYKSLYYEAGLEFYRKHAIHGMAWHGMAWHGSALVIMLL